MRWGWMPARCPTKQPNPFACRQGSKNTSGVVCSRWWAETMGEEPTQTTILYGSPVGRMLRVEKWWGEEWLVHCHSSWGPHGQWHQYPGTNLALPVLSLPTFPIWPPSHLHNHPLPSESMHHVLCPQGQCESTVPHLPQRVARIVTQDFHLLSHSDAPPCRSLGTCQPSLCARLLHSNSFVSGIWNCAAPHEHTGHSFCYQDYLKSSHLFSFANRNSSLCSLLCSLSYSLLQTSKKSH